LRHPDELDDLGLRELATAGSVLLVEWPERAAGRLGPHDLTVHLEYADEGGRHAEFVAETSAGRAVLASI
jgi:Predicted ATPase or kinase